MSKPSQQGQPVSQQISRQTIDEQFMRKAIALAAKGKFTTSPNPNVGCVIVRDGKVIGKGYHQQAGQAHAEINALADARGQVEGATVYVTLEPCFHQGRTGPCVEALIKAKVKRVVIANIDPNPKVSGQSVEKLNAVGIEVCTGILADEAYRLNVGFFKRMHSGLPFIRVKTAMSLDGKIAMADGESQWISGETARADVQRLRAAACAVLSSATTVLHDDAKLNVRLEGATRQPYRVILDRDLQLLKSPQLQIFKMPGEVILLHNSKEPTPALVSDYAATVKLVPLPLKNGHLDLSAVMRELADLACNEVLVEAGATLTGALFDAQLVDELIVYQAPKLIGHRGQSAFTLERIHKLSDAYVFYLAEYSKLGQDLKLTFKTV